MELIKDYILNQVASKNLSPDQAMKMLLELERLNKNVDEDIAIIGMSCRFAGSNNINEFYENLVKGANHIKEFPSKRIEKFDVVSNRLIRVNSNIKNIKGGFLEEIDKFDAGFFNISPKEAEYMDPLQRVLLEKTHEAIENAGYNSKNIYGSKTSVFIGNDFTNTSMYKYITEPDELNLTGSWSGNLANRISYIYNLQGSAMVIDTACSSGVVAIHEACQAIKLNECDMAIAGGICLIINNENSEIDILESNDGIIRSFDRDAKGTTWGEGAAILLLKPLNKSLKDRDNIMAIIRGSSINNDGRSNGITAPNGDAHEKIIIDAWQKARINPEDINYIEGHGSGTVLGDAIELQSIIRSFKKFTNKKNFCGLGSTKPNIGHTVAVSGIASLIKVVLSFINNKIPASLNYKNPNSYVDMTDSPIYVNDKLKEWARGDKKRIACVHSFGITGTNCHIVLEESPYLGSENINEKDIKIFTLSAKSENILKELVNRYIVFFSNEQNPNLEDICFTANAGRDHYSHRLAIVFNNGNELIKYLSMAKELNLVDYNNEDGNILYGEKKERKKADKVKIQENENNNIKNTKLGNLKVEEYLDKKISGDLESIIKSIGKLYVGGADINWDLFYTNGNRRRVGLPTYPFERMSYWPKTNVKKRTDISSCNNMLSGNKNGNCTEPDDIPIDDIILSGRDNNDYSETEKKVATIWNKVLGINKFNIYDDFYELGGDSIQALKALNLLSRHLNIRLSMIQLFEYPELARLAEFLDKSRENIFTLIEPAKPKDYYPLTSAQKRIYILSHMDKDSIEYNIPIILEVKGKLNVEHLENALKSLIERHEAFRTQFEMIEGEVMQKVCPFVNFKMKYGNYVENQDFREFIKPFDLGKAPLFRTELLKINDEKHILMMDMHHIVIDGISSGIFVEEFTGLYNNEDLEELRIQYKDYAVWLQEEQVQEKLDLQKNYWLNQFNGIIPKLEIVTDHKRPATRSNIGNAINFEMGEEFTGKIRKLAKRYSLTVFSVLLSAFYILISKYSEQEDIIIGFPISGRYHPDLERIIGMFVNTLPLRNRPEGRKKYGVFLEEIKNNLYKAYDNQQYQFEDLIRELKLTRTPDSNPLFDIVFAMESKETAEFKLNDLEINLLRNLEYEIARFDLTLFATEKKDTIALSLRYRVDLFKKETMGKYMVNYVEILNRVIENDNLLLQDIEFQSNQVLVESALEDKNADFNF